MDTEEFKIVGEKETDNKDMHDAIERIRESLDASGMEFESLNEALDTLTQMFDKPPMKETKSLVVVGMALHSAKDLISEIGDLFENLCILVRKGHLDADVKNRFIEHANVLIDDLLAINSALAKTTVAIENDLVQGKGQE